ncbi:MAG: hypothetical protein ACJ71Q_06050 [Terriglobales bacterium]
MNDNPVEEVLKDLFRYFELLETESRAIRQFLKENGIATDEKLAPYLEQAANASSVKWRAAKVRMERLFALAAQPAETQVEKIENKIENKEAGEQKRGEDLKSSAAAGEQQKAMKFGETGVSPTGAEGPSHKEAVARSEPAEGTKSAPENTTPSSEISSASVRTKKTTETDSKAESATKSGVSESKKAA